MSQISLPYSVKLARARAKLDAELADKKRRTMLVCYCPKVGVYQPGGDGTEVEWYTTAPPKRRCQHCGELHYGFEVVVPPLMMKEN